MNQNILNFKVEDRDVNKNLSSGRGITFIIPAYNEEKNNHYNKYSEPMGINEF